MAVGAIPDIAVIGAGDAADGDAGNPLCFAGVFWHDDSLGVEDVQPIGPQAAIGGVIAGGVILARVADLETLGEALGKRNGIPCADDRAPGQHVIGDGRKASTVSRRAGGSSQRRDEDSRRAFIAILRRRVARDKGNGEEQNGQRPPARELRRT